MGWRRWPLFWALALIGLGTFMLLRNAGVVAKSVSAWPVVLIVLGVVWFLDALTRRAGPGSIFWPLVVAAIGVILLLRDLDVITSNFSVWPVVIIALGVAILLAAIPLRGRGALTRSIALDGAVSARVRISHGAGELRVAAGAAPGQLLDGTFHGGVDEKVRRDGDRLEVTLGQTWGHRPGWGAHGLDWSVAMASNLPTALDLKTGASA